MLNSIVLDVFIGLIFIFLLYSLLATILQEIIAKWFGLRSRMLQKGIRRMLEDQSNNTSITLVNAFVELYYNLIRFFVPFHRSKKNLTRAFFDYPSIKYLAESSWNSKPSYLDPGNFSQTIIYLLRGNQYDGTLPQMNLINDALFNRRQFQTVSGSNYSIDTETLNFLQKLYRDSNGDINKFKVLLENWFNDTMDRAAGWYKKQTQLILFLIGLTLAISFNVDTIAIYNLLAKDKTARDNLVQLAISSAPKYDSFINRLKQQSKPDTTYNTIKGGKAKKDTLKIKQTNYVSFNDIDSDLNNAKKLVQADVDKANSIAALGWPDKDSCKMYDSLKAEYICSCKNKSPDTANLKTKMNYYNSTYKCSGNPYQNSNTRLTGWLLTALAISLGAPFWFDLLNKFIQLRATGPKPQASDSNSPVAKGNNDNAGSSPINRVG